MNENYYAGAYWGVRRETAEQCAARAEVLFRLLSSIDPAFAHWFRQGRSRKDALSRPLETSRTALAKLVSQGKDRVVEELGFRFSAWNGASDEDATSMDVTCGGYSERVRNFCYFQLPKQGPNAERILTTTVLSNMLRSMVLSWEPDFAVATSPAHRDRGTASPKPGAFVAWITYLSARCGSVPPLPAPVTIEHVEDKGTLIVLTPERFTVNNPEHVALAEHVRELLDRGGLLKP